jgi:hypothetical protein
MIRPVAGPENQADALYSETVRAGTGVCELPLEQQ